jgi:uncharacterized membrane-anchored protein
VTVVLIRSAGTAAGDWIAHGRLGLATATLVTGVAFAAVLVLWKDSDRLGAGAAALT